MCVQVSKAKRTSLTSTYSTYSETIEHVERVEIRQLREDEFVIIIAIATYVLAICSSSRVVLGLLHQTHSMWTLPWSSTNCLPIDHTRIYPASRASRMSKRSDNNSTLWFLERMYVSIVITSILISSWERDRLWLCAEWTQVNDAFWMLGTNCLQILESHRDSTLRSESRRWYLSLLSGNCFNFSLAVIFLTG